jgi:hypothetical protein
MASKPQAMYSARDRNRFLMKYSASKAMPDWLKINRALIVSAEIGILVVYQQHSIRDRMNFKVYRFELQGIKTGNG